MTGFTLIELMVTVSIVAILAMIAYPYIIHALQKMEAKRIHHTFRNTINIAKATSYTHHKRVFMCLLDKAGNCNRDGSEQVVLFFDNNGNNNYEPAIDSLIKHNELDLKYASTHMRAGGRGRNYVRFSRNTGMPRGFFGHFKYCPTASDNLNKYQVSFNQVGIIRYKPNERHATGCE